MTQSAPFGVNNSLDFPHSQNEIQSEKTGGKQGKLKEVLDKKPREKSGKQAVEKGVVFLNTDRVPLRSSVLAGEIPQHCWLLQNINSSFHCEPGTWRIDGMGGC